jgi:phosphatidate phosphatase LPIN
MFLWEESAKIVITDVDGTITRLIYLYFENSRSDVLGTLMPIIGKDWSHSGVVSLFTNIKRNGYKIVYLTARAIGLATKTRNYLEGLEQRILD